MYRKKEECCCYSNNKIEVDKFEDYGFAMKKDTFYLNLKSPIILSNRHNIKREYKRKRVHNRLSSIYKYSHRHTHKYTIVSKKKEEKKKEEKKKSLWDWLWYKKDKDP